MDKWKDEELEKMKVSLYSITLAHFVKVGGNAALRVWFASQPDIKAGMSMQDKYNSRAAGEKPIDKVL